MLIELCRYELEQAQRAGSSDLLLNPNSIHAQLKDQNNYKFICKAIVSRDDSVVASLLDLLLLLGDY